MSRARIEIHRRMIDHTIVEMGADRFRVGPWHADPRIAYVAVAGGSPKPTEVGVQQCVALLVDRGFEGAVTAALRSYEAAPFLACGFERREILHVLRRGVTALPPAVTAPIRRARRSDRAAVLAVDHAAFAHFWQLDESGLNEALGATPSSRFRVVDEGGLTGYAICGRADDVGYLQRLAVDPHQARRGLGTALVVDALRWLRRRGARQILVNTQESNRGAVALYEHLGFRFDQDQLHVLGQTW